MRTTEAVAEGATRKLRAELDAVCAAANVWHGIGPPMAYFETAGSPAKRFVYTAFSMGYEKAEGASGRLADSTSDVIETSVTNFRAWLRPHQTLLWRAKPTIEPAGSGWSAYWRCVQLDDGARQIAITWNI